MTTEHVIDIVSILNSIRVSVNNYEGRKVARYDCPTFSVDTCAVIDGIRPFETAIMHKEYNDGKTVIVEAYNTSEDAKSGHDRWVDRMSSEPLPDRLIDCCNTSWMLDAVDGVLPSHRRVVSSAC